MTFIDAKKWELALAALMPFVLPLIDAYESGAFHGKSLVEGLVAGAIIVLRAFASHQQAPPAQ